MEGKEDNSEHGIFSSHGRKVEIVKKKKNKNCLRGRIKEKDGKDEK